MIVKGVTMVIHIFKDGTTTTELKDVYVPAEIVKSIYNTVRSEGKGKGKEDGKNHMLG